MNILNSTSVCVYSLVNQTAYTYMYYISYCSSPFQGLVGVVENPLSSSLFSSTAYFTSNRSNLRLAVTFMSSRAGEDPAWLPESLRKVKYARAESW